MRRQILIVALVSIAVLFIFNACERKIVNENKQTNLVACFTCHTDQEPALTAAHAEWEHSKHASGETVGRNTNNSPTSGLCQTCHTSEGFLSTLPGGPPVSGESFTSIGCFTCHAPHTNGNLSLRITNAVAIGKNYSYDRGQSNICAACHHALADADSLIQMDSVKLTTRWGPHHGVQSNLLLGKGGYQYAGYTYENGYHTTGVSDGCVTCHMANNVSLSVGGHSWNMIDEETGYINKVGCNADACHHGAVTSTLNIPADNDYDWDGTTEGLQSEIEGLLDSLQTLLVSGGLLDESSHLPKNNKIVMDADSAGAVFNYLLVEEDRSEGVHNPEYAAGLLRSSINYLIHHTANPAVRTGQLIARQ